MPDPAPRRSGRPRASSRAMLEEAAGELFLERGYAATSVADITQRAGVSRSSFFNYFDAKADLLWAAFDDRATALRAALKAAGDEAPPGEVVAAALGTLASTLPAEHVALAFTQADTMGLADDLRLAAARRTADLGATITAYAAARGVEPLRARVAGAAWAGALVAAVEAWAHAGADRTSLPDLLDRALTPVRPALP
ncbi:TetR/AcrR family transcriptional regulator [Cellulomonas triticagri]|uniref:TetR/AcrR family transcriptional regulator n=1 Tax=Cellulomonas triticagri TaxID=2483352 RepID=UPI001315AA02|nr:TetR/AcrR family transcriptional regulator [Cellulomonas triticagri]